jgi:hypothetical protein
MKICGVYISPAIAILCCTRVKLVEISKENSNNQALRKIPILNKYERSGKRVIFTTIYLTE